MGSHDEAVKVLEQLDNKHTFEGMDLPMTVKWVDYNLQKRGRMDDDFRGPGYGGYGVCLRYQNSINCSCERLETM